MQKHLREEIAINSDIFPSNDKRLYTDLFPYSPFSLSLSLWQPFPENASSYSSDSYSRYTSNPVNRHDDSKLREKFGSLAVASKGEKSVNSHDPYRFTRSTANPVNTATIDKSKLSDLSARYR